MLELPVNNWGRRLLVGAVLLYAAVLLLAPMLAVLGRAFQEGVGPVIEQVTSPAALQALRLSVIIAAIATVINTVFGIGIAWVLVRHPFAGRRIFDALVDLPFVVSPVIVGYVMIVLFGR